MQVFIRGQRSHCLEVTETETVADVKARVAELEGSEPDDLAVYYCGRPLPDDHVLSGCTSRLGSLEVDVRVLGGKVHGSLARAGKVKGQTPKVEKQEKKKKLTGRAKRREQYNRRIKNEVISFGKKKGPNAQER